MTIQDLLDALATKQRADLEAERRTREHQRQRLIAAIPDSVWGALEADPRTLPLRPLIRVTGTDFAPFSHSVIALTAHHQGLALPLLFVLPPPSHETRAATVIGGVTLEGPSDMATSLSIETLAEGYAIRVGRNDNHLAVAQALADAIRIARAGDPTP
jgi:hypothetical protein